MRIFHSVASPRTIASAIVMMVVAMLMVGVTTATPLGDMTVAVGGTGDVFTPANITIQVGDTVTWNNEGGWHNVVSDALKENGDPLFTSGNASTENWTESFKFTEPGSYRYVCTPHESSGMVGIVTVEAAPTALSLSAFGASGNRWPVEVWALAAGLLAGLVGSSIARRM
ncbi:MAG: cupredoxin domain-containing protein [Ardenticatenaceae bacterium]